MDVIDMSVLVGVGGIAARIAAVVVLALVAVKAGDSLIDRVFFKPSKSKGWKADEPRARTLSGLLKSALRYAAGIVSFLTVLELLGIDTKALLGGAAILGLAVGFGAQNLVRDIITGFFIIYERQYDVGDYVTIAGVSGTVEEIGLRTTTLRDWSGDVHIVPNGLVEKTTNSSRAGSRALVEVSIAYEEDIRQAISVLQKVCDQVATEMPVILEGPRVLGVTRLADSGVAISVWARTKPLEQWGVERELRLRLKEALDRAGIEIPYPRMVVYQRQEERDAPGDGVLETGTPPPGRRTSEP